MDPYLENPDHWKGIHLTLIVCCFEALNRALPPGFVARIEVSEMHQRFIEVVELAVPERVVTAIEILSPTNKTPGDGYTEYRRKQTEYIQSATHLLEIDLLRAGTHTVAASKSELEKLFGHWDYLVYLHRAGDGLRGDTWPRTVRQVLPQVLIPLTDPHPDVRLDLQSVVSRVYEAGAFDRSTDYSLSPIPALRPEDAEWAK